LSKALGEFEQLLLFAILRLGQKAYGVAIRQEIAAQTGKDVSAGAVYTGLDRLQARGYVSSWEAESAPARGGRRRKYYRLEPAGAAALDRSYRNIRLMAKGVLPKLAHLTDAARGD
jgi:DNA-binding PadR family transcriptional regulator